MSINKRMYKKCGIHTHTHLGVLAIKKNDILIFAVIWMDLEAIVLSEISQTKIIIM